MARNNEAAARKVKAALDEMQRNRGDEAAWKKSFKKVEAAEKQVDWAQYRRDRGKR